MDIIFIKRLPLETIFIRRLTNFTLDVLRDVVGGEDKIDAFINFIESDSAIKAEVTNKMEVVSVVLAGDVADEFRTFGRSYLNTNEAKKDLVKFFKGIYQKMPTTSNP